MIAAEERLGSRIVNSDSFKTNGHRHYIKLLATHRGSGQLQDIHTPFELCEEILNKVAEYANLKRAKILVLFNFEFVEILAGAGVPLSNMTFAADSDEKETMARAYGVNTCRIRYSKREGASLMPQPKKQFDVVVMNPPYQPPTKSKGGGSGSRNTIWDKFVDLSLALCKDGGYIANVHPSKWRKPLSELYPKLTKRQIEYLEMHTQEDAWRVFRASTPYDWYVLHNVDRHAPTKVRDITGQRHEFTDLSVMPFLPNCDFDAVKHLIAKEGEQRCEVLFSYTEYETRRAWMNESQDGNFKYPCVHATPKSEPARFWYSRRRGKFFGVPKIIFGEARSIQNCIIDYDGEYGITQQAMALVISSRDEGEQIKKALSSDKFDRLLQEAMRWSQFRVDWRLFTLFRKDFWKEFI